MNVIVWGINYPPEVTGIAPCNATLCEFLSAQGHAARMVTSFAYYPAWKKNPADRGRLFRTDTIRGVPVHRCWHYVPARPNAIKRIAHEATFVVSSFLRLLTLPRPDVYVVVSPPLLLGAAAWLLTRVKRAPFVFHVQDLQPDAALGLGLLRAGWFTRALYGLESIAYRTAARVSGISEGMLAAFRRKKVPATKLIYFPNGVAFPRTEDLPPRGQFRSRLGLSDSDLLVVYSGNLGVKQGLDVVLDAAALLREHAVRIVICGDGAERARLATRLERESLRNVHLLPLQPEREYREMLTDADLGLITQQAGSGASFFPSKLLTALAHGLPVLAVADMDSELTRAIATGGFGVTVPPVAPEKLAAALATLAERRETLGEWSVAGRKYAERFDVQHWLPAFELELARVVQPASPGRAFPPTKPLLNDPLPRS